MRPRRREKTMARREKIMAKSVAIIGCGKQAEKHIQGFRASGINSIFVADIYAEAVAKMAKDLEVVGLGSVEDVFSDDRVDMIDICTPTPSHAPLILKSLDAGKPFLVEKPLAASLAEAEQVVAKVNESGLTGAVGFTYRFVPVLAELKSLIDAKDAPLGDLVTATLRIGGRGSHALWKHRKDQGGGAIQEMLVHMIDLAVWYFGEIDTIEVLGCALHHKERTIGGVTHPVDAEDYVTVKLQPKSGGIVTIVADFITPSFVQYAEIQGTKGTGFGSIQPHFTPFVFKPEAGAGFERGKTEIEVPKANFVNNLIGNFVDAVNGKVEPRGNVYDALEVQRVTVEILRQASSF